MLKQKTFAKKTKRGAIVSVQREHYLRDDIYCGLMSCTLCDTRAAVLADGECVLIPDTNVVLHQV
jgi:exosome complex exonuclease DIS3/RRP44